MSHVAHRETSPLQVYLPYLEPLMQSLLATLADIDFEYEHELAKIDESAADESVKRRMRDRLVKEHQERREPYVQQLEGWRARR
jgi:hypothetical protein